MGQTNPGIQALLVRPVDVCIVTRWAPRKHRNNFTDALYREKLDGSNYSFGYCASPVMSKERDKRLNATFFTGGNYRHSIIGTKEERKRRVLLESVEEGKQRGPAAAEEDRQYLLGGCGVIYIYRLMPGSANANLGPSLRSEWVRVWVTYIQESCGLHRGLSS